MKNIPSRNHPLLVSHSRFLVLFCVVLVMAQCAPGGPPDGGYTRGVGVYPGDPADFYGPDMQIDTSYRNLALHRPAFHSSSYDYNLTAQLVTDGIVTAENPRWISTSSSQHGVFPKNERVYFVDYHQQTQVTLDGPGGWLVLEIGGDELPAVDRFVVSGTLRADEEGAPGWRCVVFGSDDGERWTELGRVSGSEKLQEPAESRRFWWWGGMPFEHMVELSTPVQHRFYRAELNAPSVATWNVREVDFYHGEDKLIFGGPHDFTSAWMSGGIGGEWVYVDLGADCSFDRIALSWINRPAAGKVQVSDDSETWRDIAELQQTAGVNEDIELARPVDGRYVRVLMTEPPADGRYVLSELEVYGSGGPVAVPKPMPPVRNDGRFDIAGGNWRVQRDTLVEGDGAALSRPGYADDEWVVATVPGTVLVSYWNAGALPDPNFGTNQLYISDSFFYADFWYRTEFAAPAATDSGRMYLNFDGINWKASVYLNGQSLGRIEGGFMRGLFDVTDYIHPGETNALAVCIEKNATPGHMKQKTYQNTDKNGGSLGADNPTYHASIGWDWIPTIRGRNTGIWNDVYLTTSGPVTLADPFVTTDLPLPDTTSVDISIEVTVTNRENRPVSGTLRGTFGAALFEQPVNLAASETKLVTVDPATAPSLRLENPRLWWPAGYGNPDLYEVELAFVTDDGAVSDRESFKTGVREMAFDESDGILKIHINGMRFVGRGGNWGFPESMLLYRDREYDIAVDYHRDMHFTMIRNWVGQTGDDEFYEACDRHGVMVWQDFWLANPVDGPNPDDEDLFMSNVRDTVRRIRNHPSIAIYVGRNEGNPPESLDNRIRAAIPEEHPGLHYISNSAFGVVSGGGPYRAMPSAHYFEQRATPKLHSEMGMPNIPTYESLKLMMPESGLWPRALDWGIHDFTIEGAQGGQSFIERLETGFGEIDSAKEWVELAQWVNYEGYRAMFEAQSKYRMGLLLWMSHPAWPSFVWQTYDYYFEPTAGYFGSKKGSEPLHILWNALSDSVEVFNYSVRNGDGLAARAELLNLDGSVQWEHEMSLDCPVDTTVRCFGVEYPENLSDVYFLRLTLLRGDEAVSENIYWRGIEEGNFQALRDVPKVALDVETEVERRGDDWNIITTLENETANPALMVRLKVVREKSGDRILPVFYSDNYIFLMPGESRTITMNLTDADTRGETPKVIIEGFNIN